MSPEFMPHPFDKAPTPRPITARMTKVMTVLVSALQLPPGLLLWQAYTMEECPDDPQGTIALGYGIIAFLCGMIVGPAGVVWAILRLKGQAMAALLALSAINVIGILWIIVFGLVIPLVRAQ